MAQVKARRSSNKSIGLVGFNPPPVFSTLQSSIPFTAYTYALESYYKLKVRSGVVAPYYPEVSIAELSPVSTISTTRLMLGSRSFSREYDGIELYLLQPTVGVRMTLCSVNELTPGYLNLVLQGHSTAMQRLNTIAFLPHLVNSMILTPLFPGHMLEYHDESKIPLRLILPSGEWIPAKVTRGERLSIQTCCSVVDSSAFPARMGQAVMPSQRWNTRYIGSDKATHSQVQLSELHAVEVSVTQASVEAQFDPDHNLDD